MRASIDIGSNSTLLLAGSYKDGEFNIILNESRVTSLGKDLDKTGVFKEESMESTFKALQEYKELLVSHGISEIKLTATEAARVAKNSKEFFSRVDKELGFKVQIINGEGEAYYTALGVALGSKSKQNELIVMDIGGASTEFIKLQLSPFEIISSVSTPVGSVRATDWEREGVLMERLEEIKNNFPLKNYKTNTLVCVAGTMTSVAAMKLGLKEFSEQRVQGLVISKESFNDFLSHALKLDVSEIIDNCPYLVKRAPSIQGGLKVANNFMEELEVKEIEISTFGLRYGTLSVDKIDSKFLGS